MLMSICIISGLDEVQLTDDQYSFQHIKAFGLHNYLTLDIFQNNVVYYIDNSWKVVQVDTEKVHIKNDELKDVAVIILSILQIIELYIYFI